MGVTAGEKAHRITIEEMASHQHYTETSIGEVGTTKDNSSQGKIAAGHNGNQWSSAQAYTSNVGGNMIHNTMQPSIYLNFLIKV